MSQYATHERYCAGKYMDVKMVEGASEAEVVDGHNAACLMMTNSSSLFTPLPVDDDGIALKFAGCTMARIHWNK